MRWKVDGVEEGVGVVVDLKDEEEVWWVGLGVVDDFLMVLVLGWRVELLGTVDFSVLLMLL